MWSALLTNDLLYFSTLYHKWNVYSYSNPSLVHLRPKHRGNVFSVRMEEKIALQGRCCAQVKIKIFSRKPSKT